MEKQEAEKWSTDKKMSWSSWSSETPDGPKPIYEGQDCRDLLNDFYGITAQSLKLMDGFFDITLHVVASDGREFTFKILRSPLMNYEHLDAELDLIGHYQKHGFSIPTIIFTKEGKAYGEAEFVNEPQGTHSKRLRLQTFIKGALMNNSYNELSCQQAGDVLGRVDLSLADYHYPFYENRKEVHILMEYYKFKTVDLIAQLPEEKMRNLGSVYLKLYEEKINAIIDDLPKQVIHGDFHAMNIILNDECTDVAGFIDFTEARYTMRIIEPIIFLSGLLGKNRSAVDEPKCAERFLRAYDKHCKMSKSEKQALSVAAIGRLIQFAGGVCIMRKMKPDANLNYLCKLVDPDYCWTVIEDFLCKTGPVSEMFERFCDSDA